MSKAKAAEVERVNRDRAIIADRIAGASVEDIAEKYSIDNSTVASIVNKRLAQTLKLMESEVDILRQQEMQRLDAVQAAAWPAAMNGHIDSLKILMSAIDRRCKLLGLDAPQRVEVISLGAIEAELRRIDSQLSLADNPSWVDGETIDVEQLQLPAQGEWNGERQVLHHAPR